MTHARDTISADARERLLRILSTATCLIFFQAYMVAPLIPRLSTIFLVSGQAIGLIVPAYMIPYGVSTLFYGLLSDRLGRRRIMLAALLAFVTLTALTATAQSAAQLILWRPLTGLGASGVVPLALALMGQLCPYEERGRPLGWLFGAMAGGMAIGSTVGALLAPFIGWRGVFLGVSVLSAGVLGLLWPSQRLLGGPPPAPTGTARDLLRPIGASLDPGGGGGPTPMCCSTRSFTPASSRGSASRCSGTGFRGFCSARPSGAPPIAGGGDGSSLQALGSPPSQQPC
jgi:MFS family permease